MFISRCPFCSETSKTPNLPCPSCRTRLDSEKFDSFMYRCPSCHAPLVSPDYVCSCNGKAMPGIFSIYDYRAPVMRRLLERWKFEGCRNLSLPLSYEYLDAFSPLGLDPSSCVVQSIPCSPESRRRRGWDQMQDIARCLRRTGGFETADLIEVSSTRTVQQKTLDRSARFESARSKYAIPAKGKRTGKDIVLLDDVCTTGATLRACASLLRENGFNVRVAVTLLAEL